MSDNLERARKLYLNNSKGSDNDTQKISKNKDKKPSKATENNDENPNKDIL